MKFEAAYKKGFDNFIRVFNENTKKSEELKISNNYEYYEPSARGNFSYILDNSIIQELMSENTFLISKIKYFILSYSVVIF